MKENKYDDAIFFEQYKNMSRSTQGLSGAGEWHVFQKMFPPLTGRRVLDLGCGFGWHCAFAADRGASLVVGTDLSENMLAEARKRNARPVIEYRQVAMEDICFPDASFDVVISSLAFHYVQDFPAMCNRIFRLLTPGGDFLFSVEHPIFTAQGPQRWHCDADGNPLHWPVDNYFREGLRSANFLGETVQKYHRTLTTWLNSVLLSGFSLKEIIEPVPSEEMLATIPDMEQERRRPMMMLISAKKERL